MATGDPCACGRAMMGACPVCSSGQTWVIPQLVLESGSTYEMGFKAGYQAGVNAARTLLAGLEPEIEPAPSATTAMPSTDALRRHPNAKLWECPCGRWYSDAGPGPEPACPYCALRKIADLPDRDECGDPIRLSEPRDIARSVVGPGDDSRPWEDVKRDLGLSDGSAGDGSDGPDGPGTGTQPSGPSQPGDDVGNGCPCWCHRPAPVPENPCKDCGHAVAPSAETPERGLCRPEAVITALRAYRDSGAGTDQQWWQGTEKDIWWRNYGEPLLAAFEEVVSQAPDCNHVFTGANGATGSCRKCGVDFWTAYPKAGTDT